MKEFNEYDYGIEFKSRLNIEFDRMHRSKSTSRSVPANNNDNDEDDYGGCCVMINDRPAGARSASICLRIE